jgi:hypothetical protein
MFFLQPKQEQQQQKKDYRGKQFQALAKVFGMFVVLKGLGYVFRPKRA